MSNQTWVFEILHDSDWSFLVVFHKIHFDIIKTTVQFCVPRRDFIYFSSFRSKIHRFCCWSSIEDSRPIEPHQSLFNSWVYNHFSLFQHNTIQWKKSRPSSARERRAMSCTSMNLPSPSQSSLSFANRSIKSYSKVLNSLFGHSEESKPKLMLCRKRYPFLSILSKQWMALILDL